MLIQSVSKAKSTVVPAKKQKGASTEISIDFLEFDHIRLDVHYIAQEFGYKSTKRPYDYSYFYVGRSCSCIVCRDFKPGIVISKIANELQTRYPEYDVYMKHDRISVYLRGKPTRDIGNKCFKRQLTRVV